MSDGYSDVRNHIVSRSYGTERQKLDGGTKNDTDKPALDLLPTQALEDIAEVFAYGAQKYGRLNWTNGFHWSRLIGASMRHLFAWCRGEALDPETKRSHLAHLGCNVLMLIEHERNKLGTDDRYISPK